MLYTNDIKYVKAFPVLFTNINRNFVVANNVNELYELNPDSGTGFWNLESLMSAALNEQQLKDWKINAINAIQKVCQLLTTGDTQEAKYFDIKTNHETRCQLATALLNNLINPKETTNDR